MATIDINTATADQFNGVEGRRGHGPELVCYSEERGRFTDVRQLDEVPGLAGVLLDDQGAQLSADGDGSA